MENKGEIYSSIVSCMREIGAITKDKRNKSQGYSFRGIEDVYNAVHPVLVKNNVCIAPEILDVKRECSQSAKGQTIIFTILTVRHRFYAQDGSYIDAVTVGEGMDYGGDKSSNKAMSAAYKYAMFETLCIPTEMIDSEDDSYDNQSYAPAPSKPKNKTSGDQDIDESYNKACEYINSNYSGNEWLIDKGMREADFPTWDAFDTTLTDLTFREKESIVDIGRILFKHIMENK